MENKKNYISNKYEEWRTLRETVESGLWGDSGSKEVEIVVSVSCNMRNPQSDVLLLQYFFPIADIIREKYKMNSRLIIFLVDGVDGNVDDMTHRVQHYLCIQAILRRSIKFEIHYNDKNNKEKVISNFSQTSFGRISPIMVFTSQNQNPQFYYSNIFNNTADICSKVIGNERDKSFFDFLKTLYDAVRVYDNKEDIVAVAESSEYKTLLSYTDIVSETFKENITGLQGLAASNITEELTI